MSGAAAAGFSVRRATAADLPVLAALRHALFVELGKARLADEPQFLAACSSAYAALFAEDRAAAWLAEPPDGGAVATASLLVFPRLPTPERAGALEGYLLGVFTVRAWRGRGVGAELTRAAIDEARRRGLCRIRLHATEAGRRVYAASGFLPRADEMELAL